MNPWGFSASRASQSMGAGPGPTRSSDGGFCMATGGDECASDTGSAGGGCAT